MAKKVARKSGRKPASKPKPNAQEERERALLDGLSDVARKVGVEVRHGHLQARGVRSIGGACRVGEQWMVLIDRRLPTAEQVDLLATELKRFPLDEIFVPPALRDLIQPHAAIAE